MLFTIILNLNTVFERLLVLIQMGIVPIIIKGNFIEYSSAKSEIIQKPIWTNTNFPYVAIEPSLLSYSPPPPSSQRYGALS